MGTKWFVDEDGKLTSTYHYGSNDETTGNPNGSIEGNFGDVLYDTSNQIMYKCISNPSGYEWVVI